MVGIFTEDLGRVALVLEDYITSRIFNPVDEVAVMVVPLLAGCKGPVSSRTVSHEPSIAKAKFLTSSGV